MTRTVIVRVTATEFETKDGRTIPHPVPFDPDNVPTVEEFQRWYDQWYEVFHRQGLLPPADQSDAGGGADG